MLLPPRSAMANEAVLHARTLGIKARLRRQSRLPLRQHVLQANRALAHVDEASCRTPQAVFTDHSLFGFSDASRCAL